eukprot:CAMPEP_0176462508 /NCGR_PEP_ID=MMETSP0127-20121128/35312_1 /TAXON_ID=938130 /ORGANISM="Platyophrya macrostoma, Strain WH" /LENGTH=204 /DNA_ID=CAMNT_0017854445 /DNA_START=1 /DNA_END=615 /DNA_ORIENTATION=+
MVVEDQKSNRAGGHIPSAHPYAYTSPHHTPHTPPLQFAQQNACRGWAPGSAAVPPYVSTSVAPNSNNSEYVSAGSSWTAPPYNTTMTAGGTPGTAQGGNNPSNPPLLHSSGPSSPTTSVAGAPQMPLPPSYMEAIRSGSTSTVPGSHLTPSVSVEHSPMMRPRHSDSVVMSPVIAEAPKYTSIAPPSPPLQTAAAAAAGHISPA